MISSVLHHTPLTRRRMAGQRGLSLIELMISVVIGLILLIGITTLIVQQNANRSELEKTSRQVENGRYAIQILHDDIEHAGFYSYYNSLPTPPALLPDPCITTPLTGGGSIDEGMSLPIQGYTALPTTWSCGTYGLVAANYVPGTSILVIRRADTNSIAPPFTSPAPTTGVIYLQANTSNHVLAVGPNVSTFTLTYQTQTNKNVVGIYPYLVHIYFISPCDVPANGTTCQVAANGTGPDDNGRPIPTLKRLELTATSTGSTTFSMTPLVEGIVNLQLQYGIDSNNDGYPDNNYATLPVSTADWSNVMNISVNLLAQNTECTTGFTDTKTYTLGSMVIPASSVSATVAPCNNGDYKRHVFTEVVRAINPSGRRALY